MSVLSAEYIDGGAGRILVVVRSPEAGATSSVLIVPPFGEEMNKCRRQCATLAMALNQCGYSVAIPDLYGTGDSAGELADASWLTWCEDIRATAEWLSGRGIPVRMAVGIRLGCALLFDSFRDRPRALRRVSLWQPVTDGRQFMNQFLRLRIASSMMSGGQAETAEGLRARLSSEGVLEIAGYTVSESLWLDIETIAEDRFIAPNIDFLHVHEISRSSRDGLSPVGQRLVAKLSDRVSVSWSRIDGDPFWASTETVVSPTLTESSTNWLIA